ncbi:MAG TPA: mechanosensitive ion channel domain-containing protein [Burkholderiales bacterium]|nr:mechanosensitive ion channel domain-containing protein [Burkholderiales bacterium]
MIPESLETLLRQWMAPGLSVAIAFAVAATAYRAGVIVLRRITRHRPVAALFLKLAEGPGLAVTALIVLQAVLQSAPNDLEGIGAVRHAAALLLIAAATWLALRLTAGIADAVALRHPMNVADNLGARRIQTQTRLLTRLLASIVALVGTAFALLTFPGVRSIGASLLASAGIAGLVLGVAAKAVLGNLLAGLHVAMTQPIRIDDVVIIEGEYGRVEEIGSSFVVVAIWDGRRLVVPLQQFMEKPFQNWTRVSGDILGTVFLWVDYGTPLEPLRAELRRICESAPEWDRRVCLIQVTDAGEHAMQLRALVSSADSPRNWDLRCLVRERLLDFIRREYPECLPRARTVELASGEDSGAAGRPEAATRSKARETEAMV